MVKKILIGVVIVLVLGAGVLAYLRSATKKHSPADVAAYNQNGLNIKVNYCKPYKKNRIIFGDEQTGALQPYGKYWRAGANEATTFETENDILINNQELKAGKYALYVIPQAKTWTIAFNTENDRWGATAPDEKNDVLRVEVPCIEQTSTQEQFTITFEPQDSLVSMILNWDNIKTVVPIQAKK